jgi:hypothetical protein
VSNARLQQRRPAQGSLQFALLCLSLFCALSCCAGVRHFTYVYEAITSPPGSFDVENWLTWRTHTPGDAELDELEFRHEFEFGLTENFQAAIYLADWSYANRASIGRSGFAYSDSALELIHNLTNPVIDPLGLSIYQEYKIGDHLSEWESKVIAQKNLGPLILAYNATLEAAWEGSDLQERTGEIAQAFGASYEISPRVSVGIEFLHETIFPEWNSEDSVTNFFVGPNVSLRRGSAFVTVTALAQATRTIDEPDFQMRTIFGLAF